MGKTRINIGPFEGTFEVELLRYQGTEDGLNADMSFKDSKSTFYTISAFYPTLYGYMPFKDPKLKVYFTPYPRILPNRVKCLLKTRKAYFTPYPRFTRLGKTKRGYAF